MRAAARHGPLNAVRAELVEAVFFLKEEVEPLAIAALRVDRLRANGDGRARALLSRRVSMASAPNRTMVPAEWPLGKL